MNDFDKEIQSYLDEFDKFIPFDSELCGICGVKVSDSIKVPQSPFIALTEFFDKIKAQKFCEILQNEKIEFKVTEELNTEILESVSYKYKILVRIKDIDAAKKIPSEF